MDRSVGRSVGTIVRQTNVPPSFLSPLHQILPSDSFPCHVASYRYVPHVRVDQQLYSLFCLLVSRNIRKYLRGVESSRDPNRQYPGGAIRILVFGRLFQSTRLLRFLRLPLNEEGKNIQPVVETIKISTSIPPFTEPRREMKFSPHRRNHRRE